MLQAINLARLPDWTAPFEVDVPRCDASAAPIEIPGGPVEIGAGHDGFAYDNERPRHERELAGFTIARHPVTNASWLEFAAGGGYVRREWWSEEAWAWKQQ